MAGLDPIDKDMMVRAVLGEAANQSDLGKAAVAHVILNRVRSPKFAGDTPTDVILQKNQFEPFNPGPTRARIMAIKPSDPAYQRAARIVDAVASGAPDPTGGATNFANVQTVRDRNGGSVGNHTWINPANATATIGAHTFFAPAGRVASTEGEPFAYAPDTTPAKAPALDAISSATKGSTAMADDTDPLAAFKKALADHQTAQQNLQQAQNPLRGILGRALHHGLTSMFPGLGAPNAPQAFPPAAQPAPFNAAADLPGGTNSDVPIPLPPERPTDVGDAGAAGVTAPPGPTAGAPPHDLMSGQNAGLPFPGMGADQNATSPAFASMDAPGAGFGPGMGGLAALFGLA
jgi:hypothetical protein